MLCITMGCKLELPGGSKMCLGQMATGFGKWSGSPGDPKIPGTEVGVEKRGVRIKVSRDTGKANFVSFL